MHISCVYDRELFTTIMKGSDRTSEGSCLGYMHISPVYDRDLLTTILNESDRASEGCCLGLGSRLKGVVVGLEGGLMAGVGGTWDKMGLWRCC